MVKVGITGGIGSGKTTVSRIFSTYSIPVFYADTEAKKLTNTDEQIRQNLISLFGTDIYLPDQTIDRKKLSSIIFNDKSLLQTVNNIIHPVVREYFISWAEQQNAPFVLHEAAILFESGFAGMMDYNILVISDEKLKIKRLQERDNANEEQIKQRMANQWPDEQKEKLADFIIRNNENELLIPQVLNIIKTIETHG